MKTSAIIHNPNARFLTLYADFIAICAYESESPKKGIVVKNDDCAAALLALYENFHNSEKGDRFSNSFLEKCLQYHYSPKTIIEANKLLEYEGYIVITRNKISETENAPNSISLNVKAVNEQLGKMLELRIEKGEGEYFYPTVILHNPYRKFTVPYRKITENKDNSNNNSNNKKEKEKEKNYVASDQVLELLPNPITQTKQASKGSAETQNSKLVLSAFDELLTKHEIKYTYPNSAALWRPIHSCCKQILSEVGAEGVADFFAKVDSMYKSHTFPFKDKSNLVLTFIGSAKIIPMILNYQASTPQNQISQQPHPNFPSRPLYINLFADKWTKVKWWRTNLAELENGQDKEFSFTEISKMLQYTEPLNILK